MKYLYVLFILFICISLNTYCQTDSTKDYKQGIIGWADCGKYWNYAFEDHSKIFLYDSQDLSLELSSIYKKYKGSVTHNYLRNIYKYIESNTSFGREQKAYYRSDKPPVELFWKGKELVCCVNGYIGISLNTIKLNEIERAKDVLSRNILPSYAKLQENINSEHIYYYGVGLTYGCKDFIEKDKQNDAEYLIMIVDKENLRKYIDADITDSEFIKNSEVYLSNTNSNYKLKKISIY